MLVGGFDVSETGGNVGAVDFIEFSNSDDFSEDRVSGLCEHLLDGFLVCGFPAGLSVLRDFDFKDVLEETNKLRWRSDVDFGLVGSFFLRCDNSKSNKLFDFISFFSFLFYNMLV